MDLKVLHQKLLREYLFYLIIYNKARY